MDQSGGDFDILNLEVMSWPGNNEEEKKLEKSQISCHVAVRNYYTANITWSRLTMRMNGEGHRRRKSNSQNLKNDRDPTLTAPGSWLCVHPVKIRFAVSQEDIRVRVPKVNQSIPNTHQTKL